MKVWDQAQRLNLYSDLLPTALQGPVPSECNRVPTEIQKQNSMIFPSFSMIYIVISAT